MTQVISKEELKANLIKLISAEITKLKEGGDDENGYWMSNEHNAFLHDLSEKMKSEFGYDWEDDEPYVEWCLHASPEEILQYHLDVTIPNL